MNETWPAALEASALAAALRGSEWAYPLINTGHLLGISLLIGSIVPLDLRLLGFWASAPLAPLWRVLTRTAGLGLAIAITCGVPLFMTRATEYAGSGLFTAKMAVVAAAMLNAAALTVLTASHPLPDRPKAHQVPLYTRLAALVSLLTWPTALLLGRLVGYF